MVRGLLLQTECIELYSFLECFIVLLRSCDSFAFLCGLLCSVYQTLRPLCAASEMQLSTPLRASWQKDSIPCSSLTAAWGWACRLARLPLLSSPLLSILVLLYCVDLFIPCRPNSRTIWCSCRAKQKRRAIQTSLSSIHAHQATMCPAACALIASLAFSALAPAVLRCANNSFLSFR